MQVCRYESVLSLLKLASLASAFAIALSACTGGGPPYGPIARELTWFSYLAGNDIRSNCGAVREDRYRFVYNAVYTEQVRAYDLAIGPKGAGMLEITVFGGIELGHTSRSGPLSLWFGQHDSAVLAPGQVNSILGALAASGFEDPPPVGAWLDSGNFYWVIYACRNGNFNFNAFVAPFEQPVTASFTDLLFLHDRTGVAVKDFRRRPVRGMDRPGRPQHEAAARGGARFRFRVSPLGIVYYSTP